jgi:hypothetical protein
VTVRPPIPNAPHPGGCLCGAVRYRLTARPFAINACHCTDCKKSSGGAFGLFLHATDAILVHESGDLSRYRKTAESGREIDIARCAACGTRLWHQPVSAPEFRFIAAGTLDDSRWAVPTSHIWAKTRAPDVVFADDALVFDGPPPDRQPVWNRFTEIYG